MKEQRSGVTVTDACDGDAGRETDSSSRLMIGCDETRQRTKFRDKRAGHPFRRRVFDNGGNGGNWKVAVVCCRL